VTSFRCKIRFYYNYVFCYLFIYRINSANSYVLCCVCVCVFYYSLKDQFCWLQVIRYVCVCDRAYEIIFRQQIFLTNVRRRPSIALCALRRVLHITLCPVNYYYIRLEFRHVNIIYIIHGSDT